MMLLACDTSRTITLYDCHQNYHICYDPPNPMASFRGSHPCLILSKFSFIFNHLHCLSILLSGCSCSSTFFCRLCASFAAITIFVTPNLRVNVIKIDMSFIMLSTSDIFSSCFCMFTTFLN